MPDLASAQKHAWLSGADPARVAEPSPFEPIDFVLLDFDWGWDDGAEGFCARCARSVWLCDCDLAPTERLDLWPAPCSMCDGDCVYEARVRGRLVPIGVCASCRGTGGRHATTRSVGAAATLPTSNASDHG